MKYDLFEHRHNFSVWAAARAAQRGFTNVDNLRKAIEQCGVKEFLRQADALDTSAGEFEDRHRTWCGSVQCFLCDQGVNNSTYGRAAKLIAVYLKSMVVIVAPGTSSLAQVAHPPIDRILLQNLSRSDEVESDHKAKWGNVNWTQLDAEAYYILIEQLRDVLPPEAPFWVLEQYWTVTQLT